MTKGPKEGICPNCEAKGQVGERCPTDVCRRKGYHFIPQGWYQSAKEYAARRHKVLNPLLGRSIDRYLLIGLLGEGGMGAVYLAYQRPLNREVAFKIISGIDITDAAIARFEREARAIAILEHANILKLYDYGIGQLEGVRIPYMSMEYVRHGRGLKRALAEVKEKHGTIPIAVIQTIFRQVLNGLGAAHEQGIVHRDVKPDNIMIAPEHGNPYMVKILDFGLAKAFSGLSGFDNDVTTGGLILGTPAYMAPEQGPGQGSVDGRADLYAVATILFEIFTGVRPFVCDSPVELLRLKQKPTFNPLDLPEARTLPPRLRAFFEKGLAPKPEERFQTASEMLAAFEAATAQDELGAATTINFRVSPSSHTPPATPPSSAPDPSEERPTLPMRCRSGVGLGTTVAGPPAAKKRWFLWLSTAVASLFFLVAILFYFSSGPSPIEESVSAPTTTPSSPLAPFSEAQPRDGAKHGPSRAQDKEAASHEVISAYRFVIRTRPPGASIYIDGRFLGVSPVSYDFSSSAEGLSRKVELLASMPDFQEVRQTLLLSEAVSAGEVEIVLERLSRPIKKPQPPRKPKPPTRRQEPTML